MIVCDKEAQCQEILDTFQKKLRLNRPCVVQGAVHEQLIDQRALKIWFQI